MQSSNYSFFFFFNDTATTEIYTLSLHDALPISTHYPPESGGSRPGTEWTAGRDRCTQPGGHPTEADRKSTRLNSSHVRISYAVFCLKKKKKTEISRKSCDSRRRIVTHWNTSDSG